MFATFFFLFFFVDSRIDKFFFFMMADLLLLFLAVRVFVFSKNYWCRLWSIRANIILSISSSRFYFCAILIIWKMYAFRSGFRSSWKRELSSKQGLGFLISIYFAAPFLITSLYLAIVPKSDCVWHIIQKTTLSQVGKSNHLYWFFRIDHILCILFISLMWMQKPSSQFNWMVPHAWKYLLSQSKSFFSYFFIFALYTFFVNFVFTTALINVLSFLI